MQGARAPGSHETTSGPIQRGSAHWSFGLGSGGDELVKVFGRCSELLGNKRQGSGEAVPWRGLASLCGQDKTRCLEK